MPVRVDTVRFVTLSLDGNVMLPEDKFVKYAFVPVIALK